MGVFVHSKHNLLILMSLIAALLIPILGLFGLLAWAMIDSRGNMGEFGIKDVSSVTIEESAAPRNFTGTDLYGNLVSLSDFHGSVVMIDFWSSWCGPCIGEAPLLETIYDEYVGRGVEFIGIAVWDDQEDIRRHINRFGVSYTNLIDHDGTIAIDYGVSGIPDKVFIGRDGTTTKRFSGPITEYDLRSILNNLLVSNTSTTG